MDLREMLRMRSLQNSDNKARVILEKGRLQHLRGRYQDEMSDSVEDAETVEHRQQGTDDHEERKVAVPQRELPGRDE